MLLPKIPLRKKLSEKIARFSTQKFDPATGVTAANWVSFDFNVSYSSCSLINTLKLKKIYYFQHVPARVSESTRQQDLL